MMVSPPSTFRLATGLGAVLSTVNARVPVAVLPRALVLVTDSVYWPSVSVAGRVMSAFHAPLASAVASPGSSVTCLLLSMMLSFSLAPASATPAILIGWPASAALTVSSVPAIWPMMACLPEVFIVIFVVVSGPRLPAASSEVTLTV